MLHMGNTLLGEELQTEAKNSKFDEILKSALYIKSVSRPMPLSFPNFTSRAMANLHANLTKSKPKDPLVLVSSYTNSLQFLLQHTQCHLLKNSSLSTYP